MNNLSEDLELIAGKTADIWHELCGRRIFITGGTGFFGCWLLESFCYVNQKLDLGAKAVVLTRSPDAFARKCPHLALNPSVSMHCGDVRTFDFPPGEFDF